jgi:para-aminobenzoate synthetase component 1
MIVDLVRNDLSRISETGTISVPHLCEVYSFPNVHQMISTVEGKLKENISFKDIIYKTFPMGSMTGAPKSTAMGIIDEFEDFNRGLFSGSMGYISDENDFDFNVVIRSIFIDEKNKKISVFAGSAITIDSDPELEYQECLLKANSIIEAMGGCLED